MEYRKLLRDESLKIFGGGGNERVLENLKNWKYDEAFFGEVWHT